MGELYVFVDSHPKPVPPSKDTHPKYTRFILDNVEQEKGWPKGDTWIGDFAQERQDWFRWECDSRLHRYSDDKLILRAQRIFEDRARRGKYKYNPESPLDNMRFDWLPEWERVLLKECGPRRWDLIPKIQTNVDGHE